MNVETAYAFAQSGSSGAGKGSDLFRMFSSAYARERRETMSMTDYLEGCRDNPGMTATAAERMIAAIGDPVVVDTSKDPRLGRIFLNRTIKVYPSMSGFFGMEDTIQRVVSYFQHAAQGLEERKQILYLLGPVGGGKSSLAERLKALVETQPIYVLAAGEEMSPVFESPLGLFRPETMGDLLEDRYGIALRRLTGVCSPWAAKRLDAFDGDLSRFSVVKLYPSKLRQIAVAKTEPGDENNQDISTLVGKVDIRKLEHFSQHDGRLQLFGRAQPHDARAPRIRGNVQGADQSAASAFDRDPGGQLRRDREHRGAAVPGDRARPLERVGMGAVQEQQEQRGVP